MFSWEPLLWLGPLALIAGAAALSLRRAAEGSRALGVPVRYVRAVDGDTVRVEMLDLEGDMPVRLYGIDAPERGEPGAAEATARVHELCSSARELAVARPPRGSMEGKYYPQRIVADLLVDGRSLSRALVDEGLAREAYGGL